MEYKILQAANKNVEHLARCAVSTNTKTAAKYFTDKEIAL